SLNPSSRSWPSALAGPDMVAMNPTLTFSAACAGSANSAAAAVTSRARFMNMPNSPRVECRTRSDRHPSDARCANQKNRAGRMPGRVESGKGFEGDEREGVLHAGQRLELL